MIILIGGGSCSGKTTLAQSFSDACIISMDDFYLGKSRMKPPYNFDVPEAIDLTGLVEVVCGLKEGKMVRIPQYSMLKSERTGIKKVVPKPIIVVEGFLALWDKRLRALADLKIFLDVPLDIRVQRRIKRDIDRNGRNAQQTLTHSLTVEEMHEKYVEPTKKFADLILSF